MILFFLLLVFDCINSSTEIVLTGPRIVWKFAVISDTQNDHCDVNVKSCINDKILKTIAVDIAAGMPDFVLVSGDLVNGWLRHDGRDYSGQYADWKEAMYPVLNAGIKIYPVRGNHDSGPELYVVRPLPEELDLLPGSPEELEQGYNEQIVECLVPENGPEGEEGFTFSFVYRNALVIGLDQYADRQHRVNQAWLDATLAANNRQHIFVFGHEPAFMADHKDNLSFFPNERNLFWDSIGKAGGRIYFCGHDHFYNRALIPDSKGNPVWQVTAGTGGGELQSWSGRYGNGDKVECEYHNDDYYGYVLVTVDGCDVKVEWRALVDPDNNGWQVMDEFSYNAAQVEDEMSGRQLP